MKLLQYIRAYTQQPLVRPWALLGPVLVLVLCLPLLRPLRQPDSAQWSDREQMTAATIQAIAEHHTLAIDQSVFASNPVAQTHDGRRYSPYPPMLALLLAPVYWVLLRQGLDYGSDLIFVQYVLTFIGISLPVAMCAAMVYRLARMFELKRILRVGMGLATVMATGLISYGVVMNPHAPAAALLLASISCMSHLIVTEHPYRDLPMVLLAGVLAALAAAVDPPAIVLGTLLCLVPLAMRWNAVTRIGGVILFLAGGAPVILLNGVLLHAAGTPLQEVFVEPQRGATSSSSLPSLTLPTIAVASLDQSSPAEFDDEFDPESEPSAVQVAWSHAAHYIGRVLECLVGEHGVLSHFPALVLGLLGGTMVLHRNWTTATKTLASLTLLAAAILVLGYSSQDSARAMSYGAPWFIATGPVLFLWAGAWFRRKHRPQSWIAMSLVLVFSILAGLAGVADPDPLGGYPGYSFAQSSMRLLGTQATPGDQPRAVPQPSPLAN